MIRVTYMGLRIRRSVITIASGKGESTVIAGPAGLAAGSGTGGATVDSARLTSMVLAGCCGRSELIVDDRI